MTIGEFKKIVDEWNEKDTNRELFILTNGGDDVECPRGIKQVKDDDINEHSLLLLCIY